MPESIAFQPESDQYCAETFKCRDCGTVWTHVWDTTDYNDDFTQCPECFGFDFDDTAPPQPPSLSSASAQ